ncbi:sigma 54-interacting transcriptional regulator [Bacteroides caecimuris]|nr:sigma 54-interacting transcriptional regulator [Bacteroides caecimuris]
MQAIHNSKQSKQNFVEVRCLSFNKELLESKMFGHNYPNNAVFYCNFLYMILAFLV